MKAELEEVKMQLATKQLGGITRAGSQEEKKEETPHEHRVRIEKELAEGKFDK